MLDVYVTGHIDDVLIHSENIKDYRTHIKQVIRRFYNDGLQIAIEKYELKTTYIKYLSLIITPKGIKMDSGKVKAILDWKPLPNFKDL